jgi:hypothetical protein
MVSRYGGSAGDGISVVGVGSAAAAAEGGGGAAVLLNGDTGGGENGHWAEGRGG